jgi:hypothetical protein
VNLHEDQLNISVRAEHEVGGRWVVMAIRYDDEYQRIDGQWLLTGRRERHWYANDLAEHPQSAGFTAGLTPQQRHSCRKLTPRGRRFGRDTTPVH